MGDEIKRRPNKGRVEQSRSNGVARVLARRGAYYPVRFRILIFKLERTIAIGRGTLRDWIASKRFFAGGHTRRDAFRHCILSHKGKAQLTDYAQTSWPLDDESPHCHWPALRADDGPPEARPKRPPRAFRRASPQYTLARGPPAPQRGRARCE